MKPTTGMIPLATGNILPKRKNRLSCLFLDILKKYIPDGKRQDEPSKPISQQETADEQQEYFSMKLLSLIHELTTHNPT